MKLNLAVYAVLVGVFLLSIGGVLLVPAPDQFLRILISVPGVTALVGALFQILRDASEHQKRLEIQSREFAFALATSSHMARVAFDKHAAFCEAYLGEVRKAVETLYRKGDTSEALSHAAELMNIRLSFDAWLTDKMTADLMEFEGALTRLGADAHFINSTAGTAAYAEQRSLKIDQNFALFSRILGLEGNDGVKQSSMVEALRGKIREILNVEALTAARDRAIQSASQQGGG